MQYRSAVRVAGAALAVLTVTLVLQAIAAAEPWPAWDASTLDPAIHVTESYDQGTGYYKYTVAIDDEVLGRDPVYRPGELNYWHEFRAFVVYPTNIGSYQPPADNSFYAKGPEGYLDNTPHWTGTNGGFQLKGENADGKEVPAVPEDPSPSACFGWRGGGPNEGWYPIASLDYDELNRQYTAEFYANLQGEKPHWEQTHFSLHVRDGGTWWAANARGNPSSHPTVPEPGTFALLATGAVGVLPLLRRRRTT